MALKYASTFATGWLHAELHEYLKCVHSTGTIRKIGKVKRLWEDMKRCWSTLMQRQIVLCTLYTNKLIDGKWSSCLSLLILYSHILRSLGLSLNVVDMFVIHCKNSRLSGASNNIFGNTVLIFAVVHQSHGEDYFTTNLKNIKLRQLRAGILNSEATHLEFS